MTLDYNAQQKKLTVRQVDHFPQEVFNHAEEVEILDMSQGHLTELPEDIHRFTKLRVAFFSQNDFETIPQALAGCKSLEMIGFKSCKIRDWAEDAFPTSIKAIILTDNKIASLPKSVGKYTELKKLMLAGNSIQSLPESLLECKNLELLRLPVNQLQKAPEWLFDLPRLGWYNDGANPFHTSDRTHVDGQKTFSWHDITIGDELGKSANSTVYLGKLKTGEEVAVKIYGSDITTDGLPIDDMNACLLAGVHPNIIGGMGKLVDIPDNKQGLVMPLISNTYTKLGNPPSFQTFTRDTFPSDKEFTKAFITQVLKDVSSAMMHCHSKGIMHGDLYAHNVLTDAQGRSYMGDFGAASLYNPKDSNIREKVDVKSFGYLIEDLMQQCSEKEAFQSLREVCLKTNLSERPTFREIQELL